MKVAWLGFCALVGCGDVAGKTVDARQADSRGADTSVDSAPAPRCSPTGQFSTQTPLSTINISSASDEGGWQSPDELTLYFDSTRTGTLGGYDIFMATRADRDS